MPSRVVAFLLALSGFAAAAHTAVADTPASPPEFEWAISAAGPEHDKTRGLAVDPDGNVLVTGEFTGTAAFGDHKRTAVGSMDFFIAK
ncbi:MAG: SBBP repeat-containing protein, partial [Planctomycetaceae bacterium]|nr:SBBP repeat-containing protein [Planctomycetaceae bacterium]